MTLNEIMEQLQELGQPSIKKVLMNHGIPEPLFGAKIEDMKSKILKHIKNRNDIALQLYDTGYYDARYLAGLAADPATFSRTDLQHWVNTANAPILFECTVAWIASESPFAVDIALEWINAPDSGIASAGWAALASYVAITPDAEIDMNLIKNLLDRAEQQITTSKNRVKYNMNVFVICVGSYITELNELAKATATRIGKVKVDMGDTACKVPSAVEYIQKVEAKRGIGKKKKEARC